MANRNTPRRVAQWFRGSIPVVMFVDEHTVASYNRIPFPVKAPTAPGYWWSADDGWSGPFSSESEALDDGKKFLTRR